MVKPSGITNYLFPIKKPEDETRNRLIEKLLVKYIIIRITEDYPNSLNKLKSKKYFDVKYLVSYLHLHIPDFKEKINCYVSEFLKLSITK